MSRAGQGQTGGQAGGGLRTPRSGLSGSQLSPRWRRRQSHHCHPQQERARAGRADKRDVRPQFKRQVGGEPSKGQGRSGRQTEASSRASAAGEPGGREGKAGPCRSDGGGAAAQGRGAAEAGGGTRNERRGKFQGQKLPHCEERSKRNKK